MRARKVRALLVKLCGEPLSQRGSHAKFRSVDQERVFGFSKHDRETLAGEFVRSILVDDAGLSVEEARRELKGGRR